MIAHASQRSTWNEFSILATILAAAAIDVLFVGNRMIVVQVALFAAAILYNIAHSIVPHSKKTGEPDVAADAGVIFSSVSSRGSPFQAFSRFLSLPYPKSQYRPTKASQS